MRFRTGFLLGLGIGYVLGTRAGRERYEQLKTTVDALASSPQAARAMEAAERGTRPLRRATGEALVGAARTLRDRAEGQAPSR